MLHHSTVAYPTLYYLMADRLLHRSNLSHTGPLKPPRKNVGTCCTTACPLTKDMFLEMMSPQRIFYEGELPRRRTANGSTT